MRKKPLMIGLFISLVFWLLLIGAAMAGPYLVSDPYPAAAIQPTGFIITLNGTTYQAAPDAANGNRLYFDLAGKWKDGTNSATVKARNLWGGKRGRGPFRFFGRCAGRAWWTWFVYKLTGRCCK